MADNITSSLKSKDEIADKTQAIMEGLGYKIESGDKYSAEYGKGSKLMRILLGAFANRFVFLVKVADNGVELDKHGVSSVSGGAIGNARYQNQYKAVKEALEVGLK